ncbi:AbrB family transcriptional regulator [Nitratireductor basaltis]|uniref:Membrane protein AbrB n=1 Tax=Nitratireductor basaltis TaxID=472175 RepID=A0A084U910_9HYPH|nr:AbrB family transcriptional regulator [Nitratireductor basaltis]KFB09446.1 Membrane protein AbrB [Nitratireductor basaltis]
MSEDSETIAASNGFFANRSRLLQWSALILLSSIIAGAMILWRLPAALLVGPMLGAIALGGWGGSIRFPKTAFGAAQSMVGLLIGGSLEMSVLLSFFDIWPILALAVIATVSASSFLGWLVSRLKVLPGSTAIWGSAPGAATAMVLMAGAFGADQRLVAFMQYLRVIFVSVGAALIARIWVDFSGEEVAATSYFPAFDGLPLLIAVTIGLAGAAFGRLVRLPAPYFLGAFLAGAVAHLGFGLPVDLPPWLLGICFTVIGWRIGLEFDRALLLVALKALPQIVLSILALMAFCGGVAWFLHWEWGIDPLTAYLATSPGGMDTVAVIAAASPDVNISLIMAVQLARFLFVLLLGPAISRMVAGTVKA